MDDDGRPSAPTDINSEKKTSSDEELQQGTQSPVAADVPPDGGYGWICVIAVFLVNAHTWGVNSVFVDFPRSRTIG